jgi:proline iminopeptidase
MKNIFLLAFFNLSSIFCWASSSRAHVVQERFIESRDAKLYCSVQGKGPPLLVIHGGPGLSHEYLHQLDVLTDSYTLLFYDQRGCGMSTTEIGPETITIDAFIEDIEAYRKACNYDTVSILGHSWGGFLAMQYAIRYPEHIHTLILSNTMPCASDDCMSFFQEYTRRLEPFQEEITKIKESKAFCEHDPEAVETYYRLIFKTYCHDSKMAEKLSLSMSKNACKGGAEVAAILRKVFMEPFSLYEKLETLNIKTLIIHGESDPIPCNAVKKIHESIPGSHFVVLKACGHFPYVEQPEAYFAQIRKFLQN